MRLSSNRMPEKGNKRHSERRIIPGKDFPKKCGMRPLPPGKYLQVQYVQDSVFALDDLSAGVQALGRRPPAGARASPP